MGDRKVRNHHAVHLVRVSMEELRFSERGLNHTINISSVKMQRFLAGSRRSQQMEGSFVVCVFTRRKNAR
ncbi:hypothetical protein Naga_100032g28 [Nannochloropsis gaditana]|uniref:Uncharacterized protein n=1 Tax=Nannochloropsis gaditana TaxID=72520 RepID=W7TY12_9STRA|nr:hypothetical protein Naga_100032g28 [Nannochloropsis gaditana]